MFSDKQQFGRASTFYAQVVKADVIFFDARSAAKTSWTKKLWIYDFRTNVHKTLKQNKLTQSDFKDARLTCAEMGPHTVPSYKARGMKDSWYLASSLNESNGREIIDLYAKRFECEEAFRDFKDRRYGLGLRFTSIANPQRRERLLLIVAIAYFFLTLAGVTSERLGIDRIIKANTSPKRTHSQFRQGREVLTGVLPDDIENRFIQAFQSLFGFAMGKGFCHALS